MPVSAVPSRHATDVDNGGFGSRTSGTTVRLTRAIVHKPRDAFKFEAKAQRGSEQSWTEKNIADLATDWEPAHQQ